MYVRLHAKYRLFLSDFNETGILWTDIRKKNIYSNFMKIGPVGAELFHAVRRTYGWAHMNKLIRERT